MKVMNGLDLQSQRIQNLASPSTSTDAANKAYVDALAAGLEWKQEVRAASTAPGTLATAYANGSTIDGYTLVTGDRILIRAQSSPIENGIYIVAASGAPARATDASTSASLNNATVLVTKGTTLADTAWTQTTADPTVGTSSIVFAQFGAGTSYSAGNGLALSTGTFSVVANGTSLDVSSSGVRVSSSALGNGLTGGSGTVVSVNNGTGLVFSGSQLTTDHSIIPQKYSTTLATSSTSYTVTHGLGTVDVITTVYTISDGSVVFADVLNATTNTVTINFAVAPSASAYRVVVIG